MHDPAAEGPAPAPVAPAARGPRPVGAGSQRQPAVVTPAARRALATAAATAAQAEGERNVAGSNAAQYASVDELMQVSRTCDLQIERLKRHHGEFALESSFSAGHAKTIVPLIFLGRGGRIRL